MKKRTIYILLAILSLFLFALGFNIWNKQQPVQANINNEGQEQLENYVKENPSDIESKKSLAWEYIMNRNYSKANQLNEEIIREKKNDTETLHRLVIGYLYTNQINEAEKASGRLLEFNQHNPVALTNLSQIYFIQGNEAGFIETINKAFEAANISGQDGNENEFYRMLKEDISKFEQQDKNNGEPYLELAEKEYFDPRFRISVLNKAISLNELIDPNAYTLKSLLELEINEIEEAVSTTTKLIQHFPEYEYGFLLAADIAQKSSNKSLLNQISSESPTSFAKTFSEALLNFDKEPSKSLESIEKLLNQSKEEVKPLLLYQAAFMSKEMGNKELLNKYYSEFEANEANENNPQYFISMTRNLDFSIKPE